MNDPAAHGLLNAPIVFPVQAESTTGLVDLAVQAPFGVLVVGFLAIYALLTLVRIAADRLD